MEKKKAAAAAMAATIAATGVATDAAFDNPADILQNTTGEPVVEPLNPGATGDDDGVQDDEKKGTKEKDAKESATRADSLREAVLKLPLAVRILFVLPIWLLGHGIVAGGTILFTALSPFLNGLLTFLLLLGVVTGAFTVAAKSMFPDLPLGKILNRHTFKGIFILVVIFFGADLVLSLTWAEYAHFKYIIKGAATLLPLLILVIWFSLREKRRRVREEAETKTQEPPSNELVYESMGQTFIIRDPNAREK